MLFVALMGWNVGLNAGGGIGGGPQAWLLGLLGMAPVVVGLLIATGWLLSNTNHVGEAPAWHVWAVTGVAGVIVWRTRIHLLWLLGAGAALGTLGFV